LVNKDGAPRRSLGWSWEGVLKTLLALVALVAMLATLRFFTRPPSADQLYADIKAYQRHGSSQSLQRAERSIERFLREHPDDPRAAEVAELKGATDLDRLQRRLEARAQRRQRGETPIEAVYLDLLRHSVADPAAARPEVESFVNLYAHSDHVSAEDQRYVDLARRLLQRIEAQVAEQRQDQRVLLSERIEEAKRLIDSAPQNARAILAAVVHLCGQQPDLQDLAESAKALLSRMDLGAGTTAPTSVEPTEGGPPAGP
jgi:hypothetical protein